MCIVGDGQDLFSQLLDVMDHMCIPSSRVCIMCATPPPPKKKESVYPVLAVIHFIYASDFPAFSKFSGSPTPQPLPFPHSALMAHTSIPSPTSLRI